MNLTPRLSFVALVVFATSLSSLASAQDAARQRSLADLLEPGQHVTLSGGESSYSVRVYPLALKEATLEINELLSHASAKEPNNSARARAMIDAARRGGGPMDAEMLRELTSRSRGGFSSSRNLAPERVTFYEVAEIGKDFVAFRQGNSTRFLSLANIREIAMTEISDEEAQKQAHAQIASTHAMVFSRMLAAYAADMRQLPTQTQGLQALVRPPMDLEDTSGWRGPYFAKPAIPDDPWGQPYTWIANEDGAQVEVRTGGPDGKPNTADDIVASAPVLIVSSEGAFGGGGGFGADGGFGGGSPFGGRRGAEFEAPARPEAPRAPRPVDSPPSRPEEAPR